jgi:hypothetical protein
MTGVMGWVTEIAITAVRIAMARQQLQSRDSEAA